MGREKKTKFDTIDTAKQIDDLAARLKVLYAGQDKAGAFYRRFHQLLFAYVSHRIPEIADEIYKIDDALKAGFGWEIGAFESWDVLGVAEVLEQMNSAGVTAAPWVKQMLNKGFLGFYKTEMGQLKYYDPRTQSYLPVPGTGTIVLLEHLEEKTVW